MNIPISSFDSEIGFQVRFEATARNFRVPGRELAVGNGRSVRAQRRLSAGQTVPLWQTQLLPRTAKHTRNTIP
jgi:hypothetical protein